MNKIIKVINFITIALAVITMFLMSSAAMFSENLGSISTTINSILLIVLLTLAIVFLIINALHYFKTGFHNYCYSDSEDFEEIDEIKRFWKSLNHNYTRTIGYINYCYNHGRPNKLIENNNLLELYKRKDYLIATTNFYESAVTSLASFLLSVIASIFTLIFNPITSNKVADQTVNEATSETTDGIIVTLILLISIFGFFAILFLRYYYRGHLNSFNHNLDNYELRILEEKIAQIEGSIIIQPDNINYVWTIHNLFGELEYLFTHTKRKKKLDIENDIETIQSLNLELPQEPPVIQKQYYIISKKRKKKIIPKPIYIAYVSDENGVLQFASKEFEIIHEITTKYGLYIDTN